jgi:tRNA pseudouridine38-40 synthase
VPKLKMIVAYDGTDFFGFQRQPDRRTVQGLLEETIARICGHPVQVAGAGRTDAGVHARGQVCHFETAHPMPLDRWASVLNRMLPRDVVVRSVEEAAPHFHARKDACWKSYCYRIDTRSVPDVFTRRFRLHFPLSLDVEAMQRAAGFLEGTHDFTSFSSARSPVENRVRTIYRCRVKGEGPLVSIEIVGNGFLYNMVRIIAGTLLEVGRGKRTPEEIPDVIRAKNRAAAGKTLPPEGLTMEEVGYAPWEGKTSPEPGGQGENP